MVKAIETSKLVYVPVEGGMRQATDEELSYYGWDRQPFYYHEIEFQALQAERDALEAECESLREQLAEAVSEISGRICAEEAGHEA